MRTLIISFSNKEELPEKRKESIIEPIYEKGDKTNWNDYSSVLILPTKYKTLSNFYRSRLIPYSEEIIGIINVGFDATGWLLFIYYAFVKFLRKNGNTMKQIGDRKCLLPLGAEMFVFQVVIQKIKDQDI